MRLTGLGTSMEELEATGKRLSDFVKTLGLPFELFPMAEKAGNLDLERLNVSNREVVAVSFSNLLQPSFSIRTQHPVTRKRWRRTLASPCDEEEMGVMQRRATLVSLLSMF